MSGISDNLSHVHAQIERAASSSGAKQQVKLLCVTKTKPEEMVEEAYKCGERLFGESYAVEASEKIEHLREKGYKDIVWHFIGPIQKNKTRLIAEHFDVVVVGDLRRTELGRAACRERVYGQVYN